MLLPQLTLIAETRLADISTRYQPEVAKDAGLSPTLIVAAVVVIAVALLVFQFFVRKPKVDTSPIGLLNELCRVQGVGMAGNRLINEIALAARLQHPAIMLLDQGSFDAAVESATAKIKMDRGKKKTLGILRRMLFEA